MSKPLYVFVDKENEEFAAIKLKDPRYDGLIYHYGKIGFKPEEELDRMKIIFDFEVIENPKNLTNDDFNNQDFIDLLGDIIIDILSSSITEQKEILRGNVK